MLALQLWSGGATCCRINTIYSSFNYPLRPVCRPVRRTSMEIVLWKWFYGDSSMEIVKTLQAEQLSSL